jgi:hypothetical protein
MGAWRLLKLEEKADELFDDINIKAKLEIDCENEKKELRLVLHDMDKEIKNIKYQAKEAILLINQANLADGIEKKIDKYHAKLPNVNRS